MMPKITLAAVAASPRAPAQTRDSPSSNCGHMQTMLPGIRSRKQPIQIQRHEWIHVKLERRDLGLSD